MYKKESLSINKSYLSKLYKDLTQGVSVATIQIIKPGKYNYNVKKPILKQKTDRGDQLVALSKYKKNIQNNQIQNNRLDIILFYFKLTTSLSESNHIIKQGLVYVNNKKITNNTVINEFSIIEVVKKPKIFYTNKIKQEISNMIENTPEIRKINEMTGIMYETPTEMKLPNNLNIGIMRRLT